MSFWQSFVEGWGWFALLLLSIGCDWLKLMIVKDFATTNGFGHIPMNPFRSTSFVQRLRKSLPEGPLRNCVRLLDWVSVSCYFGMLILLALPLIKKHLR